MKGKKNTIHVTEFRCFSPLKFFENCIKCAKGGKCRERGLIMQLLSGKKKIDYVKLEEKREKVVKVVKICPSCPSIWEAYTEDGKRLHIRYRWGYLSIEDWYTGKFIFASQVGDDKDGYMNYCQLKNHTKRYIEWPDKEQEEDLTCS